MRHRPQEHRSWQGSTDKWAGKVKVDDEEYSLNGDFIEATLKLATEVELDEIEAAKLLLEVTDDPEIPGSSLLEKGVIRFHLQREYLLNCARLCIEIADDETLEAELTDAFGAMVNESIFCIATPGRPLPTGRKIVPRLVDAMHEVKVWAQKTTERLAALSFVHQDNLDQVTEVQETIEFSRKALVTQHELLAVILCAAIKKHHADVLDFHNHIAVLKRADKYDQMLGTRPHEHWLARTRLTLLPSAPISCSWSIYQRVWIDGRQR